MGNRTLRVEPEEMRSVGAEFGRLGGETGQVQGHLRQSWGRLDAGWESYAKRNVEGQYRAAMDELRRMSAMLGQMGRAVHQTADRIEEADQAAGAFFGDVGSGERVGGKKGLARPLPPSTIPPWRRDGFEWWAEGFEEEHGRPPTVEEYEAFRVSWALSGEGQVQWTEADWEAFHYARQGGGGGVDSAWCGLWGGLDGSAGAGCGGGAEYRGGDVGR